MFGWLIPLLLRAFEHLPLKCIVETEAERLASFVKPVVPDYRVELAVGAVNGLLWAFVVAAIAVVWFGDLRIGAIIAVAIFINLLCAAVSGVGIPMLLKLLGVDPALAGNVVLTTVTDVVGFMAFMGLATLFLL